MGFPQLGKPSCTQRWDILMGYLKYMVCVMCIEKTTSSSRCEVRMSSGCMAYIICRGHQHLICDGKEATGSPHANVDCLCPVSVSQFRVKVFDLVLSKSKFDCQLKSLAALPIITPDPMH